MSIVTQGARSADFLLSEANGQRSRAQVSLQISTAAISAGTVLALSTDGYAPYEAGVTAADAQLAILFHNKPASEEVRQVTVILRDAEVERSRLIGLDEAAETALLSQGIVVLPG